MNKIINKSISSPVQVAIISILLTIFIASGVRWFIIDDDFFKMFPRDLESRLLWEDMTSEFGDSEFLFIAFGNDEKEIYNLETINTVRTLTDELEKISRQIPNQKSKIQWRWAYRYQWILKKSL